MWIQLEKITMIANKQRQNAQKNGYLFGPTLAAAVRCKMHPSLFEPCTSCLLCSYKPHRTLTATEEWWVWQTLFPLDELPTFQRHDKWARKQSGRRAASHHAKIHYQCCHFVILKLKRVHLKANDAYHFVDRKANGYSNKWISGQRKTYLFSIAHAREVKSLKVWKSNM